MCDERTNTKIEHQSFCIFLKSIIHVYDFDIQLETRVRAKPYTYNVREIDVRVLLYDRQREGNPEWNISFL